MLQLGLFKDLLPLEVRDLQCKWIQAIQSRLSTEKTNIYEIIDGSIEPVFLCEEYYKAREEERACFDSLCFYTKDYKVFSDVEFWLDK